jgi:hypothetical protein
LARAIVGFLRHHTKAHLIRDALNKQVEVVADVLERVDIYVDHRVNWQNIEALQKHPLLLAPCIFPRLVNVALCGRLGPAYNWGIPKSLAGNDALDYLAKGKGRAFELADMADRQVGQEEIWHSMWHGCVTTNGDTLQVLLYSSTRPTMRKSNLAKRLGLEERPYRYDNLLSVSLLLPSTPSYLH